VFVFFPAALFFSPETEERVPEIDSPSSGDQNSSRPRPGGHLWYGKKARATQAQKTMVEDGGQQVGKRDQIVRKAFSVRARTDRPFRGTGDRLKAHEVKREVKVKRTKKGNPGPH